MERGTTDPEKTGSFSCMDVSEITGKDPKVFCLADTVLRLTWL
jgi:hypothetical protein